MGQPPWLHTRRLTRPADCPFTVVSGHVPFREVQFLEGHRRILVDTLEGGREMLSAVLLPEMEVVTSDQG
jgi:hypothetical protein